MEKIVQDGPWRATRLWNSIVSNLHEGIPRKKHRKLTKTYEDCFTANEAIEWLYRHLKRNPNFDSDVTKEQTLLLLQKLNRAGVILKIDEEFNISNLSKTPSANLIENGSKFKAGGDLYKLAPHSSAVLNTPGKKKECKKPPRSPLDDLSNFSKSERHQGILRRSFRKIRNKNLFKNDSTDSNDEEEMEEETLDAKELNISYLQSLPANSLVVLDNDSMWRNVYSDLLKSKLSEAHIKTLNLNVANIIYNMTKVSEKGVVQLQSKEQDLPKWTLSAMKCLANWPRPFQSASSAMMPSYDGFEVDVYQVVKEYFTSLPSPLTTFELFDLFVSTFIKAEAVSALQQPQNKRDSYRFAITPMPYLETDLDFSRPSLASTPSGYYSASSLNSNVGRMVTSQERTANIRPTMNCMGVRQSQPQPLSTQMSPTAIMRNFLPPNTCFETAFMHENPITRIVPQRGNEIIHYSRPSSRMSSVRLPASSAASSSHWDSKSIATQTSDDENSEPRKIRQPKWKRSSRSRKSIAVMETNRETGQLLNRIRSSSYSTSNLPPPPPQNSKIRGSSSVENFLDDDEKTFLQKYQQLPPCEPVSRNRRFSMVSLPEMKKMSPTSNDHVILSKTVRAEKRKQKEKREKSMEHLSDICNDSRKSYRHLAVRTPMHICGENAPIPSYFDEGMQKARAEPFFGSIETLNERGRNLAIETFQLLGLLLPPENRRKLQLLLKFMRRVRSKNGLKLHSRKSCQDVIVETFSEAILRPHFDLANYDEELCRKIVVFFMDHYEEIWTPPVGLRKEVEERVYQSLVNKRIEAGEDPYPITFCKRVPSKVYEKEKVAGVQAAMFDLLDQILSDKRMNVREKRKKLKKFKVAYPEIYAQKFPTTSDEPEFLRSKSSFSMLKNVMRI